MTNDGPPHDELTILRGIARRIGEGWRANQMHQEWRLSPVHAEPMTPAEVAAIWPEPVADE